MSALEELVARVEAATGPDRELDAILCVAFDHMGSAATRIVDGKAEPRYLDGGAKVLTFIANHPDKGPCADHYLLPALTASLDAALALVERVGTTGIDAAQLLHQALEEMANGGWRDDRPIAPQICLYLLHALLRALQAQAPTGNRNDGATLKTPDSESQQETLKR